VSIDVLSAAGGIKSVQRGVVGSGLSSIISTVDPEKSVVFRNGNVGLSSAGNRNSAVVLVSENEVRIQGPYYGYVFFTVVEYRAVKVQRGVSYPGFGVNITTPIETVNRDKAFIYEHTGYSVFSDERMCRVGFNGASRVTARYTNKGSPNGNAVVWQVIEYA
jgi:hypothetical protein